MQIEQTPLKSHASKAQVRAIAGPDRLLLDIIGVMAVTGLSRAKIYEAAANGEFPAAKKIGPKLVRWDRRDVMAWIDGLPSASYRAAPEQAAA
jgi:predicted DNA-binding transcriptional regulator AlpA